MSAATGSPVDDLIRDLGEVRVAADEARADTTARTAIESAIWGATRAIAVAIRQPDSAETVRCAREAVQRAGALLSSLSSEVARGRRLASTAAGLRLRGRTRRGTP